jgi:hypothetical protein
MNKVTIESRSVKTRAADLRVGQLGYFDRCDGVRIVVIRTYDSHLVSLVDGEVWCLSDSENMFVTLLPIDTKIVLEAGEQSKI